MEIFKIIILSLSGLMLVFAGAMRLFNPIKSYCLQSYADNSKLKLEAKVDIFNEMRGAGSLTLLAGIVILLGIVIPTLRLSSFVVAVLIFIGFAIGRALSMNLDGKPNKQLGQGLMFEIVFGTLNIFGLVNSLA